MSPEADRPSLVRPSVFSCAWNLSVWGAALLVLGALVALIPGGFLAMGWPFVMVLALAVVAQLRPITGGSAFAEQVSAALAFVFAAMYLWGLWPAVLIQVVVVGITELGPPHTSRWKELFNTGQYVVSVGAAWLVLLATGHAATPQQPLTELRVSDLLWVLGSWVVYHLVNISLVSATAAAEGKRYWQFFLEDFWFYTFSAFAVLALSPLVVIVVLASWNSWLLLPLLLAPLLAVRKTGEISVEKEYQSLHDGLTDLPNRTLLANRATAALAAAARTGSGTTLILLDLDRFKEVNDTLGHAKGDELLAVVARRLRGAVRPSDTVARLGGDEFAVLLPAVSDPDSAMVAAQRIRTVLAQPVRLDGIGLDIEVSLGIAITDRLDLEFDELLRRADVAMYVAKDERAGAAFYDSGRDPNSPTRLGRVAALRGALDAHRLELHYQPKVAVPSWEVVGVEALARWPLPRRGYIPPDDFIPLAERSGLMHRLTRNVLAMALTQAREWWDLGMHVPIAINVSMRDLQETDMPLLVAEALDRQGLPPEALVLEITESALAQNEERAVSALRDLALVGVQSSLDDFGTGYSSLAMLERLPVHELKIDRSFVALLDDAAGNPTMVRSIIGLAQGLDVRVVAEGVETAVAMQRLADLGCDAAQGWHIAPAMDAATATRWLLDRANNPVDLRPPTLRVVHDWMS